MTDKQKLIAAIVTAEANLLSAKRALEAYELVPEHNVFADLETAQRLLEERLRRKAHKDCEGSYNCGDSLYMQDFIVDGEKYRAFLRCEYNRHDKTYYYIEAAEFSTEKLP